MSALLPRLAAGSLGTAVALAVLTTPTAALAAPGNGSSQGAASSGPATSNAPAGSAGGAVAGRSAARAGAAEQDTRAGAKEPRPAAGSGTARPDGRATGDTAQERSGSRAEFRPARPEQGRPAREAERSEEKAAPKAQPDKEQPAPKAPRPAPADPRGNNGTFKVDGPVLDTSHGNEPHVACAFRLNFFGYDAGQLATISFTAIAPTPGATTTVEGRQIVSTSPAQGGLYGGSYPIVGTWSAADLGLDPTVRQHVKVSVESLNADGSDVPGGAKHKVFWLEPCVASAPASVTTAAVPFVGPVAAPAEIAGAPVAMAATAPSSPVIPEQAGIPATPAGAGSAAPAAPAALAAVSAQGAVAAQPFFLPHGTPRSASAPTTLPFTGSAPLLVLLVGALVSLLAGAGLLAATRRSA